LKFDVADEHGSQYRTDCMSEAWDRLTTEMLRHMFREFLAHPAELLTFRKLSYRNASDPGVLHAIAEQVT